jgi:hypothetical protein
LRTVVHSTAIKDHSFKKEVDRLMVVFIPDFSITATVLLSRLEKNLASFLVELNEEEGEEFVMMVEMGLFALTGQRYQMVIPAHLDMKRVKSAALKLAQTEDDEYYLHPERLVATMPYTQAKEWQARLRLMDENQRCADRILLLDTAGDGAPRQPSQFENCSPMGCGAAAPATPASRVPRRTAAIR